MNEVEKMCRDHFNEPVLTGFKVGRLVGYGEDDWDMYLIIAYPWEKIVWHTAVGGYTWLSCLKGQDVVVPNHPKYEGELWDDYSRLDNLLELNGCPKVEEFTTANKQYIKPMSYEYIENKKP